MRVSARYSFLFLTTGISFSAYKGGLLQGAGSSNVAATSKIDSATVTVAGPGAAGSSSPSSLGSEPSAGFTCTTAVSGTTAGQSTRVTWSLQRGASSGTDD